MRVMAPPRIPDNPVLDMWLRSLYSGMLGLSNELLWERTGTTLTPFSVGDSINIGTGDLTCDVINAGSILATGQIQGTTLSDGTFTITGGIVTAGGIGANFITDADLNLLTSTIRCDTLIVSDLARIGNNLEILGDAIITGLLEVIGDIETNSDVHVLGNVEVTTNIIGLGTLYIGGLSTLDDINAQDITAVSITI